MIENEFGELDGLINLLLDQAEAAAELTEEVLTMNQDEACNLVERCTRAFDVFSTARHGAVTNATVAWKAFEDVVCALRALPTVPGPEVIAVRHGEASRPVTVSGEEIVLKSEALDKAEEPIAGVWKVSGRGEMTFWLDLRAVAAGSSRVCLTVNSAAELVLSCLEAAEIERQKATISVQQVGSGWNVFLIADETRQYMVRRDGMAEEISAERLMDRGVTIFAGYLADLTHGGEEPSRELEWSASGYNELRMELQQHAEEAREFFADLPARVESLLQKSVLCLRQDTEKNRNEQEKSRRRKDAADAVQSALPEKELKNNEWILDNSDAADKGVVSVVTGESLKALTISPQAACQKCNSALPEGVNFCVRCGAPVASPERRCPNRECERPVGAGENFCGKCGTRVS